MKPDPNTITRLAVETLEAHQKREMGNEESILKLKYSVLVLQCGFITLCLLIGLLEIVR